MDERKVADLFRAAVHEAPPASFDHADVVAESGRQSARARRTLLAGSALGVSVLLGAGAAAVALWTGSGGTAGTASAPMSGGGSNNGVVSNEERLPAAAGEGSIAADQAAPPSVPSDAPKQGGASIGQAGPSGSGSTPQGCGQADRELVAALADELPAAAGSDPLPANLNCPVGSRGVTVVLRDDVGFGEFTVVLVPADADLTKQDPTRDVAMGSVTATARTADGAQVVVVSQPKLGATMPPFGSAVQPVAAALAGRL